ncbi:MAG TPA: hypothetical protein DCY79_02160 [Planctomycetaceae bacterium]|nr:hypothetical protein [Blastopirellula sp.]HAY78593.1 hypothetical protein [Planctomycetaceae bacterium]
MVLFGAALAAVYETVLASQRPEKGPRADGNSHGNARAHAAEGDAALGVAVIDQASSRRDQLVRGAAPSLSEKPHLW